MIYLRRSFPIAFVLLIALIVVACGGEQGSGSNPTPTTAPALPTITVTIPTQIPTTSSTSGNMIKTATATVSGTSETILTTSDGKTLYYRMGDTATSSGCTDGC